MRTTSCSACGAPIRWATTTKGRRMPIDPEPHPEGNIRLQELDDGIAPIAHVLDALDASMTSEPLYRSHFATCPEADEFRRKG